MRHIVTMILLAAATLASCGSGKASSAQAAESGADEHAGRRAAVPFDSDSAYAYVARQVDFGPRVPGTDTHDACGRWLAAELRRHGADTVITHSCTATAYDGTRLPLTNIMARYNPGAHERLLLVAHWDTRPMADQESDPERRAQAIDGANDGASGVGVLLEIARRLGAGDIVTTRHGIDILLVDGEDYGAPEDAVGAGDDTWCLGTQEWIKAMPYGPDDRVNAIVLDMVGGRGATFAPEMLSSYLVPDMVAAVWAAAARLGLQQRFVSGTGAAVTDDHLYLNRAGIPAIDIIESSHPATGSFNPTWHTLDDTIDNIDPATLGDVGATVTEYINTIQQ